jgi:2-amino-4-hydroxy-6-hydroxymethyldihydropteridine diphosphokinase
MQELIIGLGSNLGDRDTNIDRAITLIGEKIGRVTAKSSRVETEPWGFLSENKFLNCAIIVDAGSTSPVQEPLSGERIITVLQSIESMFGRVRTGVYTDRAIDLDILFYGDLVCSEPGLVIPHPKLHERHFVLVSLMELCPDKIHPVLNRSIRELWGMISG